jgi:hypothetical protein
MTINRSIKEMQHIITRPESRALSIKICAYLKWDQHYENNYLYCNYILLPASHITGSILYLVFRVNCTAERTVNNGLRDAKAYCVSII